MTGNTSFPIHQRLEVLMGATMLAFLNKLKNVYATGKSVEVLGLSARTKTKPTEVNSIQPTVEAQVEALRASQTSSPITAPTPSGSTVTSMDVALANASTPAAPTGLSEMITTAPKAAKRSVNGLLSALHRVFSAGQSPFTVTSLSAQTA